MNISIECDCGALAGTIDSKGMKGVRAICLCDDCQAYAHFIKRGDILDANGGTDIFPVTPAHIKLDKGLENLHCLRLSPQGMYRWFAGCCNSPIGNTQASTTLPYVGLVHTILEKKNSPQTLTELFGPVQERIQGQFGIGDLPPGTSRTVSVAFILKVIKFATLGIIKREKQPSPFFNRKGEPKIQAYVLSKQEREDLRPLCGRKRSL